jgi:hypothetical protein
MNTQNSYKKFWRKYNILRTITATVLLISFPISFTFALWVDYWDDAKRTFMQLIGVIKDWRTKE